MTRPMKTPRRTPRFLPAVMVAVACAFAMADPLMAQQPTEAPAVERDTKAIDALTRMGAYLRSLKEFQVRSETSTDEVLTSGQKLQFGGSVDYRVRQPDRLRADVRNDRVHRQFYYDGATLTQYAPRVGYYATVNAPGTIAETLRQAYQKFDLNVPLADLFFWGTDKSGIDDIKEAAVIGPATVGGVECDHYAYRQDDVDWQIWIARGASPLPQKLVITTKDEPAQPQFTALFKWNIHPNFDNATFAFVAPKGAQKIEMAVYQPAPAKN
jgi:hypothetical protein